MNAINLNNYEAWLLDFAEGNLSEEKQIELELFIMQHPELNVNLSELALVNIDETEVLFNNKQGLKKSEYDLVSETQFVAYIENQITPEEKGIIDKSCANNKTLAQELKLYQNTIAVADASIVFPNKNKLKHQNKVVWFNFSATQYSIAASVLLLLGLYIFWPKQVYVGVSQQIAMKRWPVQYDVAQSSTSNANLLAENRKQENTSVNKTRQIKTNTIVSTHTVMLVENQPKKQEELNNKVESKNEIKAEENKTLLAANETKNNVQENVSKNKTVVELITERDEDIVAQEPKKKKSFWALAERALQNLNAMGVKSVNANEENLDKSNSSTYALTLGKVSVTHKSN